MLKQTLPLDLEETCKCYGLKSTKPYKSQPELYEGNFCARGHNLQTESAIKRMRWKAFFYKRKEDCNNTPDDKNSFRFKSRKCPPRIEDLECFETDLLKMIKEIEFKRTYNTFQNQLQNDTVGEFYSNSLNSRPRLENGTRKKTLV